MKILGCLLLPFITLQLQVDCRGVDVLVDIKAIDGEVVPDKLDSGFGEHDNSLNELTVPGNLPVDPESSIGYGFRDYGASMSWMSEFENAMSVVYKCPSEFIDNHPVKIEDTFFTLYNRNISEGWRVTNWSEISKYLDKSKKTKFITHGWTSNGHFHDSIDIKDAYLDKSDYNVFIFDWSALAASCRYCFKVIPNMPNIADHYAQFLDHLIDNVGVNLKDIHLIGHSLGAHLTGFAGRRLKNGRKVGRITGLDPAGPGFDSADHGLNKYLNANDAEFVDVIHTEVNLFGTRKTHAHINFFPNGGRQQPGCKTHDWFPNLKPQICSHRRSFQLFAKSITIPEKYKARKCSKYSESFYRLEDFTQHCRGPKIVMGESTPPNARGVYYLKAKLT